MRGVGTHAAIQRKFIEGENVTSEKLLQAVQLIKSGNKAAALSILKEIVQAEPNNENAWLWLYSCIENVEQKKYCLRQAIKINPNNQNAYNALSKLESSISATPQLANHEVESGTHFALNNDREKRPAQKSRISVQTLLVGLLTIGLFCLTATLLFLFAQRNSFLGVNLPFLSSAKFENVSGNPSGYLAESVSFDYMTKNPPTPISDITLKVKYPVEMTQGESVKLLVTCINDSNQPIENLQISIWGKPSRITGVDANYFDGLNVSTTDPQFIDSGMQIEGLLAYFLTGIINSGETKEVSVNIAAITVGGYTGKIDISLDIPGKSFISYEVKFLTPVRNK
jgi:tetratricopeptide (TPR) repeat protein